MNIDEIVSKASDLPAATRLLPRLNQLLHNLDASADDIVEIIRLGPILSARVIQYSNSSAVAMETPTSELNVAISRIGLNQTYKIVSALAVKEMTIDYDGAYKQERGQLWQSAVACAVAMETLAEKLHTDKSDAYTIGLLHNIGKLAIRLAAVDNYNDVYEKMDTEPCTQVEAERAILGFDYAEVGAQVLQGWGFPEKLCDAIRHQYNPMDTSDAKESACLLHVAIYISLTLGFTHNQEKLTLNSMADALDFLYLRDQDMETLIVDINTRIIDTAEIVNVEGE